jgi:hypothetical protein
MRGREDRERASRAALDHDHSRKTGTALGCSAELHHGCAGIDESGKQRRNGCPALFGSTGGIDQTSMDRDEIRIDCA